MGKLNLLYFDNLSWDGQKLHVVRKPKLIRDFGDFARYHRFLNETMHAVAANLASPARRSPYQTLCTVSSGYDSPCVAVIARAAACAEAICIDTSRDGAPECGAAIAEHLGMRAHIIPRDGWRELRFPRFLLLRRTARRRRYHCRVPYRTFAAESCSPVTMVDYLGQESARSRRVNRSRGYLWPFTLRVSPLAWLYSMCRSILGCATD